MAQSQVPVTSNNNNSISGAARVVVRNSLGIPYVVVLAEAASTYRIQVWQGNSTEPSDPNAFTEPDAGNGPGVDPNYFGVSAAIDSNDVIHIAYLDLDTAMNGGGLRYVQFRADGINDDFQNDALAQGWVGDLPGGGQAEAHTAIAIDSKDRVHIAFTGDESNMGTLYLTVYYTNDVATPETFKTPVEVEGQDNENNCFAPDITIDADDKPQIAYLTWEPDVGTAIGDTNDAPGFTLYDIEDTPSTTANPSIAIDSSGNTHVAWRAGAGNNFGLQVREHNYGDAWNDWEVTENVQVASAILAPSIVCDGTDRYVLYEDSGNDIHYYYDIGAGWVDGEDLETGTFNTVKAKWAWFWNNDSSGKSSSDVLVQGTGGISFSLNGSPRVTNEKGGQTFKATKTGKVLSVSLYAYRQNSPTDDILVSIRSSLDGDILGSGTIPNSEIPDGGTCTASFDSPASVVANTTYYLQIERTGAMDNSNFFQISVASSDVYADGQYYVRGDSAWVPDADKDFRFIIRITESSSWQDKLDYVFTDETGSPDILFNSLQLRAYVLEKGNSAKANIGATQTQDNSAKANIPAVEYTKDNSAIASIRGAPGQWVIANIGAARYKQNNSALANILAAGEVTYEKDNSAKANILRSDEEQDSSVKSQIYRTETQDSSAKASIVSVTSKDNRARGNILAIGQQYSYATANILRVNEEQDSESRASIVRTESQSSNSKASIVRTETSDNKTIADIYKAVEYTNDQSVKASLGNKIYTRENSNTLPSDNDDNLAIAYTSDDIDDVASDNSIRVSMAGSNYVIHQYKDKNNNDTDIITPNWDGQSDVAPSSIKVSLQIYNRVDEQWDDVDEDNEADANTDFQLKGEITADLEKYYDSNYWVSHRIYQGI